MGVPSLRGNTLNAEQSEWGDEGDSVFVGLDMPFGPLGVALCRKAGGQLRLGVDICSSVVCGRHL